MRITRILYILILILIFSATCLILFSTSAIPGGYNLYAVMSGSMEPTIKTGSVIVVHKQPRYKIGDIITVIQLNSKETITHRINQIIKKTNKTEYILKGDANKSYDPQPIIQQRVIGKVLFSFPSIGYVTSFSKTLPGLIILIVIPATLIIYTELINIKNEAYRLIRERRKRKLTAFENVEEKVGEEIIAVEKEVKKDIKKIKGRKKQRS